MRALQTLQWPRGFKITGVEPYKGRMNPTQCLQAYATTVHTAGEDTSVMANYLPIMLTLMATCTQLGTKHDLNCIYQKPSELLRSYI